MASGLFNYFKAQVLSPATLDFQSGNVKVALMAPTYTPDFDTEQFYADISGDEVVGTGYVAGGQAIANPTVSQDNTNDRGKFDGDDVQWPGSTITARGAILYEDTGNPATSRLIGYIDFITNRSSIAGTFTVQWQAVGILLAQ